MDQIALSWQPERRIFTVAELNGAIAERLSQEFSNIWVSGEISGLKLAASGHCYFTIKDSESQLRAVCWRGTYRMLKFKPRDGVEILARGKIEVYEPRGEYQLIVDHIEPQGLGALQVAFEQLKKKLAAEGLFEQARKRPLPALPNRIGIVTSPTGAVIRDILQILERRFPGLHIRLYPAQVQGAGAAEAVIEGIRYFSESGWAEVLIVARGGGSLEDLWTFNEEAVARAIAACRIPVISAVGHETDFTIADFVADLRAPTPSAAAELVICTKQSLIDRIEAGEWKLLQAAHLKVSRAARRLHELSTDRAAGSLQVRINRGLQRIDDRERILLQASRAKCVDARQRWQRLDTRLRALDLRLKFAAMRRRLEQAVNTSTQRMRLRLSREKNRLMPLDAHLTQLSPLKILDRGYSIVHLPGGAVVKEASAVARGDELHVRLAKGSIDVEVI
jgi:exodeoxyribonuclease VII large subunit